MTARRYWLVASVALVAALPAQAQELEPRALSNSPVGMNVLLLATGYAYGKVGFDPVIEVENGRARLGTVAASYVRSLDVFGLGGKVGIVLPVATGKWEGNLSGVDTSTARTGLLDPLIRFSVNFIGSPALTLPEFRNYRASTVAGATLQVGMPLGQYNPDRLINLGTNRWSISPRLGVSHTAGRWVVEAMAAATFFTTNHEFFRGKTLAQDPFFEVQGHLTYLIRGQEFWAAGSVGQGWGGRSSIDGVPKHSIDNTRASLALRYPLARQHALKLAYINGTRTRLGADFDTVQLAWQYVWGGDRRPAGG
jgi:hypothetical protein